MLKKLLYNLLHYLARLILFLSPWQVKMSILDSGNMVVICAPHTSYWDSFLTFVYLLAYKVQANFLIWHTYYNKISWFFDLIGGIPVYEGRNGLVNTLNAKFSNKHDMKLFLSPEGACRAVSWKLGFYYIALEQKVPIALAYIDFTSKVIGCDVLITPTGDIQADCAKIAAFYQNIRPKCPEKFNNLNLSESQLACFKNGKQASNGL